MTTQAQIDSVAETDLIQRLSDQAALLRKMDAVAKNQTNEATAILLDKAARVIALYRAYNQCPVKP